MPTLVVEQTLSGADLGLSFGLTDLLVLDVGSRHVMYALSRTENKLVEIEVSASGALTVVNSRALTGGFSAGSAPSLEAITDATGAFSLAIAGLPAASGQSVTLSSTGALGSQTAIPAAGELVAPVHTDLGSVQALLTGRKGAGGLDLFTDTGGGFAFAATLADASDRYLADVSASVAFTIDAVAYVATTSATEDGVNLARVSSIALTQQDALGVAEGLPVNTPRELGVIQRFGETLLVVGSFDTSSLSVVRVDATGTMQIADHILDAPWTFFQGVSAIDTATYDEFAFVVAGGSEGGLSLFTVLPGGRLVFVDSLADTGTTTLYRVSAIETMVTGTRLDILASSAWEPGVTRIGYDLATLGAVLFAPDRGSVTGTAAADQIIGSDLADTLIGGAGDDTLAGGAGSDVLSGGEGADLFVMHPDGLLDTITDFDRAEDRLDLSAYDFLYDVSQLQVTPTADGAILTFQAETIHLITSDGAPLTAGELTNAKILNVDRPPLVASAQELTGSADPDTLNGAAGNDTISGLGGDDLLTGQSGNDSITGGDGDDTLDGGYGADTLSGDAGADLLVGGADNDVLNGGAGDDVIYGDEYDWTGA